MNDRGRWGGIPEEVWTYNLSGYQVLKKWLIYREREVFGRPQKFVEVREFTTIARHITALLSLRPELDSYYIVARAAAASGEEH
jgi:hypothetical protein